LTLQLNGEFKVILDEVKFFNHTSNLITNYPRLLTAMTLQLKVPKLVCSGCAKTITEAIKKVDANAIVQADAKTKLINVETQAPRTAIEMAIASAGYSPSA
jgi:copper chaperone